MQREPAKFAWNIRPSAIHERDEAARPAEVPDKPTSNRRRNAIADFISRSAFGPAPKHEREILPIHATPVELGRELPVIQTGLFPRYGELVERLYRRMGWDRKDFVGIRYEIEYPPFPSRVEVSFPLEKRV